MDWAEKTYNLSSGTHTLKCRYTNDRDDEGENCGWVDFIQWTGAPSPPPNPANWDQIKYKHDVAGRRLEKKVDSYTTRYVHDGEHIIAEYDGNNNLLRKYIYGPGIDQPVSMIEVATGSATYYYHFDALGSVVALSNASGSTVQTYEYSVYGEVSASDPNHPNPYMFAARRYDIEIGLYYNRARYYNPYTGRFLQTDPIGYGDGMNLYAYCKNNPLVFIDPLGSVASYYDMKWVASGGAWILGVTFYNANDTVADYMTFLNYDEFLDWTKTTDCCDLLPNFEEGKYGPSAPPPFPQSDPPSMSTLYFPVLFLGAGVSAEAGLEAVTATGLALGEATLVAGTFLVFFEAGTYLGEQFADPIATGMALVYMKATDVWAMAHRKGARRSTRGKHESGDRRERMDNRGEKGDARRPYSPRGGRKPKPRKRS